MILARRCEKCQDLADHGPKDGLNAYLCGKCLRGDRPLTAAETWKALNG